MRRNCNMELNLLPSIDSGDHHDRREEGSGSPQTQNQQLTIFYNGTVCVCDVTELKARAILSLANRETEERSARTPTGSEPDPSSPNNNNNLQSQLYSPTGLSMKRSLQRFLQKRRHRIQATVPYAR